MAINRFVNVDWDQPISSFVPRPFEAAMLAAKETQKDLDTKLKALESSTDPFAKLDLSGTIKIYDPTNPKSVNGVVDYDLGTKFEQQKNAIVNNLAQERTKLVNDLWDQKITQNEFDRQVANNITKSKLAYNSLAEAQNKLKVIRKQNEEAGKNKEWALQGHLGKEYLKYNTDYVKDLESNIFREYNPYAIAEKTDRPKEVVEYFDKINPEILASSVNTGSGYIRTHYREGVTKSKIEKAFTDWYNNSRVKNDILLEGYDIAYRNNIDPEAKIKVNIPVSKDKSGKIKYQEEEMKWIDSFQEKKFNEVKDMAYGFESSKGKDDVKGDPTWKYYQKKRDKEEEEALTRYSTEGMGINPQTVEKSAAELTNNITVYQTSINQLKQLMGTLPANSPEWARANSQLKWNEIQLKMRKEMKDSAEKAVNAKVNNEDKKLFTKYGEWNPGDNNDPNSLRITNEMKAAGYKPSEYTTLVGQMRYVAKKKNLPEGFYSNQDLLTEAKALSSAYNRKNQSVDNYLRSVSKNYTLQPNLITVDNTKDLKTSKAIEELYNNGIGSWEVYDENGPITDPNLTPKSLAIRQITENPVDKLGYLFSGVEELKDKKGNVTERKKYYIRPSGEHNITEKIGKDLLKENKSKSTSSEVSRYNLGLNMIYPKYATQVSEIRLNTNRDIQSGGKIIGNVSKKQTKAGTTWTVTAPGYNSENYGSEEEVLQVLSNIENQ